MEKGRDGGVKQLLGNFSGFLRNCLFRVLSVGPIPNHIAFIMDGNRRYAKKHGLGESEGHSVGFLALMSILKYCYQLGINYVTVYAFSIDNFKRKPDQVQNVMNLMQEKIEGLLNQESIVNLYGVRVYFIGNLELLSDPLRKAAEKVMAATAKNTKAVLSVCVAYTSTDEILHAVQRSVEEKQGEIQELDLNGAVDDSIAGDEDMEIGEELKHPISLMDINKHMYMSVTPDPDILVRTSGESRLSNFLLWQTTYCQLYSPTVLWPEIGLRHLVWLILIFQQNYYHLEKRKKKM